MSEILDFSNVTRLPTQNSRIGVRVAPFVPRETTSNINATRLPSETSDIEVLTSFNTNRSEIIDNSNTVLLPSKESEIGIRVVTTGESGPVGPPGPPGRDGATGAAGATGSAGQSSGGAVVFITNINAISGTVTDKAFDTSGAVLTSCTTNDLGLVVEVFATMGPSSYKPSVEVNNVVATLTMGSDHTWSGYANITLSGNTVTAVHADNASYSCSVVYAAAPEILAATFSGGYPGSQTELKAGDTFLLNVAADKLMTGLVISNYGVSSAQTITFSATFTKQITITIADRGTSSQLLSLKIKAQNAGGAFGSVYDTSSGGAVDGVNLLRLNNTYPTVTIGSIVYPATQQALKNSEVATISMTYANTDSIVFSSPNGDINISNPTIVEASKVVTRISGSYNISTTNFRAVGTRTANNAQTTSNGVVYIANTACTLTVTEPYARLRSGVTPQNYNIVITSNQNLISAPTLIAPVGAWQGAGFTGSTTVWTRALQVADGDTKGVQSWGAISGINLANLTTSAITGDGQYTVGGFTERTITIAAWPNREGSIGTNVSDTSKLLCQNNSKGVGYYVTFQGATTDAVDKFTITQPTNVYNATGNLVYNCDLANATANVSGTASFIIEETV